MALPNNNANSNGPGQGPGSQGPAQTGPKQTKNPLQGVVDSLSGGKADLQDIAKLFAALGEILAKNQATAEATRKIYKEHSNELRAQVAFQDEVLDSTKRIADLQRRMARDGKPPDMKATLDAFRELERLNKTHLEKGVFAPKQAAIMRQNIRQLGSAIKQMESSTAKALSTTDLQKFSDLMQQVNKETVQLAKNMKGVRLSTPTQDLHRARQAFHRTFGTNDRTTKYLDIAARAKKANYAHRLHIEGKHDLAADRRKDIFERVRWKGKLDDFRRADGSLDQKKFRESRDEHKESFRSRAKDAARDRGYGVVGSRIFARHLAEEDRGVAPSLMSRMAMNVVSRGEGSFGKGLVSMGAGALEGGLSGAAELAGPLAPILAGMEILKLAFDKNATMNAEVADKLGGSGIYGPGNPIDSIHQVRNNLNSPFYSSLGIGYNKNLAIASSLQQAGFSNQNLASGDIAKDNNGMLGGSFGTMQRNVYAYGRLAGLDPSQTMEQTIKLVTVYKQSLASTEDFFVRINKDSRMAGMSTMKYIQLIDEVNGQYSRSNKLIEATVDTMRLLSATGRGTAEDLKEAMDAATSGGSVRSPEVKAYLAGKIFSSPDSLRSLQGGVDLNFERSVGNVSSAFKPFNQDGNYDAGRIQKRIDDGGIPELIKLGVEAKRLATGSNGVVDQTMLKAMTGSLDAAEKAYRLKIGVSSDAAMNNPSRAGLAYSMQSSMNGEDILGQKALTVQSILEVLHQSGMKVGDTLDATKQAQAFGNPLVKGMLEKLQTTPEKATTLLNSLVRASAQASAQLAQGGMSNVDPNSKEGRDQREYFEKMYSMVSEDGGFKGQKMTGDKVLDLKTLANSGDEGQALIISALSKNESTVRDIASNPVMAKLMRPIVTDEEKKADLDKAKSLNSGTRDTAQIWADTWTYLFNRIQAPLDGIAKLLAKLPMLTSSYATDGQMSDIDKAIASGDFDKTIENLGTDITDLQKKLEEATTAHQETTALDKQLAESKAELARLQKLEGMAKDPYTRGYIDKDEATRGLGDLKEVGPVNLRNQVAAMSQLGVSPSSVSSVFLGSQGGLSVPAKPATIFNTTIHNQSVGFAAEGIDASNLFFSAPRETAKTQVR